MGNKTQTRERSASPSANNIPGIYESDSARSSNAGISQSQERLDNGENQNNIPFLTIQTKTWNKNSFGLFDYESRDIQKKTIKVVGTCKLTRNEVMKDSVEIEAFNELLQKPDTPNTARESQLARFYYRNGGYWVYHKNQVDVAHVYQNPEEKLWYVIKHFHGSSNQGGGNRSGNRNGRRLEKNDIVKFGRVRLRVRDIDYAEKDPQINISAQIQQQNQRHGSTAAQNKRGQTNQASQDDIQIVNQMMLQRQQQNEDLFENLEGADENLMLTTTRKGRGQTPVTKNKLKEDTAAAEHSHRTSIASSTNGQPTCRICWGTDETDDQGNFNPLISPCNCIGTINSIHLKCLKGWLETKRTMKVHRGQVVIKFKKLDCELCKQVFPFQIVHNNRIVDIVDIEKPSNDYIVFESINSASVPQKVFYIINTENKQHIRIGRGQESDVRITDDISVSRCHATIKKSNKGDYYLEDFNSKFGTLVQLQYPLHLTPQLYSNQPIVFQSGKTCMTIQVRQQVSCFSACFRPQKKEDPATLMCIDHKHFFPKEFGKTIIKPKRQDSKQGIIKRTSKGKASSPDRDAPQNLIIPVQRIIENEGENDDNQQQQPQFDLLNNPNQIEGQFEFLGNGEFELEARDSVLQLNEINFVDNVRNRLSDYQSHVHAHEQVSSRINEEEGNLDDSIQYQASQPAQVDFLVRAPPPTKFNRLTELDQIALTSNINQNTNSNTIVKRDILGSPNQHFDDEISSVQQDLGFQKPAIGLTGIMIGQREPENYKQEESEEDKTVKVITEMSVNQQIQKFSSNSPTPVQNLQEDLESYQNMMSQRYQARESKLKKTKDFNVVTTMMQ